MNIHGFRVLSLQFIAVVFVRCRGNNFIDTNENNVIVYVIRYMGDNEGINCVLR